MRARVLLAPLVVLAAWLAVGAWWTQGFQAFTSFAAARVAAGPTPRPAPALDVIDEHGARWDAGAPGDRYNLVQPMYLSCATACPIAMSRLSVLSERLTDLVPERLRLVSLSVAGDPPEQLGPRWRAHGANPGWSLTTFADGPDAATLRALGVYVFVREDGVINHGLDLYLIDPAGLVVAVLDPDLPIEQQEERIRSAIP